MVWQSAGRLPAARRAITAGSSSKRDSPVTSTSNAGSRRRSSARASQVGTVSPARAGRRTTADRLTLALDLLRDPAFDALVTGESRFDDLPGVMARLAEGSLPALCHTITYDGA